eukprot:GEMP01017729.1.p1 GENE.GEMP01017729.1~~GEMP01017729.1.p1  ORF type:complete len:541 (+),score=164.08 GEMP01017729.1:118-1740(+)
MSRDFGLSEPIQLLSVDQDGSFLLHPHARELLPAKEVPIKVIAVCGLYRTGKSFLLNLLADQHGGDNRFQVGATTNACTHGMHMWLASDASTCYILLDCEGSGSLDGDRTRDARLFALAVLFSSVFVFNSRGALDENSIQALSLVTNLAWEIQKAAGSPLPAPAFMWILRDVFLRLEDQSGHAITTDQYLSQCLEDETAKRSDEARDARVKLCQLFEDRHLHTLMQPVVEEGELQNLSSLPKDRLRPDFLDQVERLRKKVFAIPPKRGVTGKPLLPHQWWSFLEACVEKMNTENAPVIVDMWTAMGHRECHRGVQVAREEFDRLVATNPLHASSPAQYSNLLKRARAEALAKFEAIAIGDGIAEYKAELTEELEQHARVMLAKREQDAAEDARKKLVSWWAQDVMDPLDAANRMHTHFDLDDAIERVRARFLLECAAVPHAEDIYEDYAALKVDEAKALVHVEEEPEVQEYHEDLWELPAARPVDLHDVDHPRPLNGDRRSTGSTNGHDTDAVVAEIAAKVKDKPVEPEEKPAKSCCVVQ